MDKRQYQVRHISDILLINLYPLATAHATQFTPSVAAVFAAAAAAKIEVNH